MDYKIRQVQNISVLDLSGEIDVSHAPHLRDTMIELIENSSGRILVNLSQVSYIDSAGLSVLIAAHRKAQSIGGGLGLNNPQGAVLQVLNLTRTTKFFEIFDTEDDAISALNNTM